MVGYRLAVLISSSNILLDSLQLGLMLTTENPNCKESYGVIPTATVAIAILCGIFGMTSLIKIRNDDNCNSVTYTIKVGFPALAENLLVLIMWAYGTQSKNCAILAEAEHLLGKVLFCGSIVFTMYRSLDMYLFAMQDELDTEDKIGMLSRGGSTSSGGVDNSSLPRKMKRSMSITEVIVQSCGRITGSPKKQHKRL